jgi:hypothetical protein
VVGIKRAASVCLDFFAVVSGVFSASKVGCPRDAAAFGYATYR